MRKITFTFSLAILMLLSFVTNAADFYWVGNSGNWSDFLNHWATTSGGATFHTNAPTQADNVYFDANSFPMPLGVVTVDAMATCKNMDWTGVTNNPDLTSWNQIDVYGSLTFSSAMTASYTGQISFKSSLPGNTVNFSTVPLSIGSIEFSGIGSWSINSNIDIAAVWGQIRVTNGTVNFNNHIYNLGMFQSWPMGISRTINFGSCTITTQNFMLMTPSSLTFNAGTSTINIASSWFDGGGFTYYDVNFPLAWSSNVQINGGNTFHNLGLNYANVTGLSIEAGKTQTINNITFGANCTTYKLVSSNNQGEAATIKKISGAVNEDFLSIRDITIIGGAVFTTNNGINLGNVTNWTINSGTPSNYYWVGNGGNWSDLSHWSDVSGGVPNKTCVPSDVSNVFFDANSFSLLGQTVNIDVEAGCNNMDWTGVTNTPQISTSTFSGLNIFGSLTLNAGMTYSSVRLNFRSNNMGNTITTAGLSIPTDITFEGNGGWLLNGSLTNTGSIYMNLGSLNTNNFDISAGSVNSYTSLSRTLILGSSTITCGSWYLWDNSNLTVNAGTSEIILTGTYFSGGSKTYYDLTLQNATSTTFVGSNSFNIINDSGSGDLIFETGSTTTFTNLIATGNCSNLINIKSQADGQSATLSLASGSITVNYASIKDISAVGGGTFNANNSVDEGNTSGWNFTLLGGTDYYWIGGAGNWSDPLNWSLISGGVANPGGCIPSQVDNVFFDGNSGLSFQAVTINQNAFCNNMTWTGANNSRLNGNSNFSLNIYGSFTFIANGLYQFNGDVFFKSAVAGNTIDTKGVTVRSNIYFNGSGAWTLNGNLTTLVSSFKSIYLSKGTLSTNNFAINTYSFNSYTTENRILNLGSSTITTNTWYISDGSNLTVNPATSIINVSATYFYGGDSDYNNVNLSTTSSVYIYGSNTFNILNASNCDNLYFEAGKTNTFTTLTIPNGTSCTNYFNLSSATQGIVTNLSMVAGTFTGNWFTITDVAVGGGGTFNANNSIGVGDVTGWNISGGAGVDLYWIGNGGLWNDPLHWSLTSGGVSYGCIPTSNDNVFFDANSFSLSGQTVDINVVAYCKNMDWTGALFSPNLTGWNPININGSLTLIASMNFDYWAVMKFLSSGAGNTIKSAGKLIAGIELNGSGEYSLTDDITLNWSGINFQNGTFNTNNKNIDITGDFTSSSTNVRTFNLGSSVINLNSWNIGDGTNMTFNAGTSTIILNTNSWIFNGAGFIYNDVELSSSTFGGALTVSGSNTFNNLTITPASEINLTSGTTQTTNNLDVIGIVGEEIILKSNVDGAIASLNQTAQVFCGDYIQIQDITASGTTFYAGDNSTNLGNNSGWTWSGVTAINQYPAGMCEDVFGGGTVAGINLTLLQTTIDGGAGSTHSWYRDYALTIPVLFPANVTVSNGEAFYDNVSNGTCSSIAEVIYTVFSWPVLSSVVTNVSCNGLNNGAINLSVVSENPPLTYLWSNAATTQDISSLSPNTYNVTVSDLSSCTSTHSAVVTEPATLTSSTTSTNISCNGLTDGAINLTVVGGTAPYTYLWSNAAITEDISGLAVGTYDVTVTDANSCTSLASGAIIQPAVLTASAVKTDVTCNGAADGTINLTVSGGTTAYTFIWSSGQTTEDISSLAPSTYDVTVTDANGCTATTSAIITEPTAILISDITTNVTCNGGSNGAIDITISGGTSPWTYFWSHGPMTEDLVGLSAGVYTFNVTDANNCDKVAAITVTEPSAISIIRNVTNITCNGASDGAINLTVSGGASPYTYLWSNAAITEDISSLVAGNYDVTVTDASSCTAITSATITEPAILTASASKTDVTCNGAADGTINLTVSGGTTAYTFIWNSGQTTEDISSLAPSTYNVTVTDANSCTATTSAIITEPTSILISDITTNVTCNGGSNGAIDITISGGTSPWTYFWSHGPMTEDLVGLSAGVYTFNVTDANNCDKVATITVTEPSAISIIRNVTNITCNGASNGVINLTVSGGTSPYTYLWSNAAITEDISSLAAGNYDVTVTDASSCIATTSATITEPAILTASASKTDVTCNGLANGTINLTVSGGTTAYSFIWSSGQTTEDISSLAPNTYNVTVTDANNCTATTSAIITEPTAITVSEVHINVSCNGGSNGAIDLTVSGGTSPFTYVWSNAATTQDLSGLLAAVYTGTITDANSCVNTGSITITEPAILTASAVKTNITCNGAANGTIDLTVAGGTIPYTYVWSNTATTQDLVGLSAGTFDVTVTDANSCTKTTSATITEPAILTASAVKTDVTCNGLANGTINLTVSGGTTAYSFIWSSGQTTEDISSLAPNTYNVTVTDANNCTATTSAIITEPTAITISEVHINVSCIGGSNGAIDLIVAGGTTPYTYVWSNAATTQDLSGLTAGVYSGTITDANNCVNTGSITITEPTILTASAVKTNITCNGAANGTIDLTVAGGTIPYTYVWSNTATTQDLVGLSAGTFDVTVTDANSCTKTTSATITEPAILTASAVKTDVTCNGLANGTINLTVSGGTTAYSFIWSSGQTTEDISSLAPSTYNVTVIDANSCTATTSAVISEPSAISVSEVHSNVSCYGGTDGAIDLLVSGGTTPFTYIWTYGQTTEDLSGLSAGTNVVTVTDGNSCTATKSVIITEPNELTSSTTLTNVTCFGGNTGAIDLSLVGGTTPMTFLWSNGAITEDISGLVAGFYSATITDANGCEVGASDNITEQSDIAISEVITHENAGNDGAIDLTVSGSTSPNTFIWSSGQTTEDISGLTAGIYSVTVTDANGCQKVKSNIIVNNIACTLSSSISRTNLLCNGDNSGTATILAIGGTSPFTYSWSNSATTNSISGLAAGTYDVTVTDASSCIAIASATISEPLVITISIFEQDNVSCYGGIDAFVNIDVTGGTIPYSYIWTYGQITQDLSGLSAGTNVVTVTDANNCTATNTVVITEPNQLISSTSLTNVTCFGGNNGAIDLSLAGGTIPFTYFWSNGAVTEDVSGLIVGFYSATITDANGCEAGATDEITQPIAFTSNILGTNITCFGNNNGIANLTITGGVSPFTYLWSNAAVTEDLSGLVAGTYDVTVTDVSSCIATASATISEPSVITISIFEQDNVSCYGGIDAFVNIDVSGGTIPYSYIWTYGQTTQDLAGLSAGTNVVTVTDANSCTATNTVVITEPNQLISSTSLTNVTCFGGNNGAIDLSLAGGTIPFTYLWSNGAVTEDILGLTAGFYSATITDANGCEVGATDEITQPSAFTANISGTNITCFGNNNGIANLTVTGGVSPFTYLWSNAAVTEDLSGLSAGTYDVTVTDVSSCIATASATISEPSVITISIFEQDNVSCYGGIDAFVNIDVSGGTIPYSYIWTYGQTTQDLAGLSAGTNVVTVTDANNCTATNTVVITEPNQLISSTSLTNVTCFSGNNGAIDLSLVGGTTPMSVVWSNGATTEDISGLTAGFYSATITDANGCEAGATDEITQPAIIIITESVTPENLGNDGAINISLTNGASPFSYNWSSGQTTEDISGLTAGIYSVTVTDNNGCQRVKTNIVVNNIACTLSSSISGTNLICDGDNSGTATVTAIGGTSPFTYSWSNSATTNSISGLAAGTYDVTVTDNASCIVTDAVTITEPAAITSSGVATDVSCFGGNNGAVDVTITGAVSPYTIIWDNGATTEDLTGLTAGLYSGTLTDANGCTTSGTATITEPAAIDITEIITNVLCYTGANGSIDLFVNGGISPYTYNWSNGASTQDINGLVAGIYDVTVTDNSSCTSTVSLTVTEPATWTITSALTHVSCNGGNNGAIDVTVTGGTPPFTYSWTGGLTTEDISGLSAGVHQLIITDINGCSNGHDVTINEPDTLNGTTLITNVTCKGGNNGAIDNTITGGVTPYSFIWDNGSSTEDLSGLTAGLYSGTLTDANGCTISGTATITEPAVIDVTEIITNVLCYTGANGSIDLFVNGGISPYTYNWSNGASTQDINGLIAGVYNVTVTDNSLCTNTVSLTISEPATWTITSILTHVSCNGGNNGAIDVTISGGTPPFTYSWTGGLTTEDISGLSAGVHQLIITDINGCSNGHDVTILEPSALSLSTVVTNISCFGANDGAIDLTVSGGTAPYTYSWVNTATTEDISGLVFAGYVVTVTDFNGCNATNSDVVTEPAQFNSSVLWTDVSCNGGNDGSIDLTLINGVTPFTILWSTGASTEDVSGLSIGNYTVTATDANGCTTDIYADIVEPTTISLSTSVTPENAGNDGAIDLTVSGGTSPYSYNWSNASIVEDLTGLATGIYNVTVIDNNGCQQIKANIVVNNIACTLTSSISGTNLLCNGDISGTATVVVIGGTAPFTYNWSNSATTSTISGLAAGTYDVTVTDGASCISTESITLTQPVIFDSYTTFTDISCFGANDGTIDLSLTGGTFPFNYLWSTGASTEDVSGLNAGMHNVTATDANGCITTNSAVIAEPAALSLTLSATDISCFGLFDGSIDASVNGGTTPYTFAWSNLASTEDLSGLSANNYSLTVTDINNCTTSETVVVNEPIQIENLVTVAICDGDSIMLEGAYQYSSGTYTDVLVAANGCDSTITTDLIVNPAYSTLSVVEVCDGSTYTLPSGIVVNSAGTFISNLTTTLGCDSIITTNVTILPSENISVDATICSSGNYILPDGSSVNTAGSYTVTLTNASGCDSTIVTNLTVNDSYSTTVNAEICDWNTYFLPDGSGVTAAGTYTTTFISVNGCDSIIVTELIVNPVYNISENVQICNGSSYELPNGTVVNSNGVYVSSLFTISGCDSTISTAITTTDEILNMIDVAICDGDSIFVEGAWQFTDGMYIDTLTAVAGCDSIVATTVTINQVYVVNEAVAICDGGSYFLADGSEVFTADVYTVTISSQIGCDSTIVTTLTVNPVYVINQSAAICEGGIYTLPNGTDVTLAGTYSSVFVSEFGCDSTIVTDLIVNPVYNLTEDVQICAGSDYVLPDGTVVNTDGSYTSNLSTTLGCDSIIVTNLVTTSEIINNVAITICEGDSIFAEGAWQYATGIFHDTTTAVFGCDSVIVTDLTVNPAYTTTENAEICEGGSYFLADGTEVFTSDDYTVTITSSTGCDSTIVTTLTVNPVYVINQSAAICEGAIYTLPNGTDVTLAGTYSSVFVSEFGCDSTIVTDLIVNPIYAITEDVQICAGSDYVLPDGTIVNSDGSYTSNLSTTLGCDSIIVTNLVTTSEIINNVAIAICEGDSIFAEGAWQYATGIFHDTTTAVFGCDSVIITNLTVNPTILVDLGADGDTLCFETAETLTLDAGNTGMSFLWSDGSTAQTFVADAIALGIGTHTIGVTVTDGVCTSTDEIVIVVDICSGIVAVKEQLNISMYPNPTRGILNIAIEGLNNDATLSIMDISGKVIMNETLSAETTTKQVDFSTLPKGIYAVKVEAGDVVKVSRIVVQ